MYMPGVVEFLYQLLPGYHLANLAEWASDGRAEAVPFPSGEVMAYDWTSSLAIVGAWIVGLVALTFLRFKRQDIN
jgi:ABC-type transport system involved in multi-copper enzyme maturation permease subunit